MMPEQEAYGYVQVESNPGIELAVDNEWHVISLRELNVDGQQLIEQLDAWENGTLADVLENVLALSINDDTEQVTITTVQERGDTKTFSTVEQITLAALTANAGRTLHIHLREASKEQWRQANKQQVPVGQFAENSRTLSSPTNENNEVQPAQIEEKEIENVNSDGQTDQPGPAEKENPDVRSPAEDSNDKSPASPSDDAGKSQPVPAEKPKPASLKENNGNKPTSSTEVPAVKKESSKSAKSSSGQPKNPNAGKDNSSVPAKPKSSTDKKENPADIKGNESKKTNQQNNDNKQKEQQNKDKQEKAKQNNNSNNDSKGKSVSEENKLKKPQNNAPKKADSNSRQPGNGQGAHNKNNSSSSSTDGKVNAPNPDKKAEKDDPQ
ncbi:hypothetical protein [Planococcus sp. ISL-109]|uniref:anti-sigma-I factor RsgI family protein n=1 Tax=Planococcus sp. ISL-109 TaxID=2819166 RepID=UPI001BEAE349|nr:hypothetical protein [Planococcus sp. ISL-109]MBT2581776.1 hypothetical protein [Planococcus sp. ISL-109]